MSLLSAIFSLQTHHFSSSQIFLHLQDIYVFLVWEGNIPCICSIWGKLEMWWVLANILDNFFPLPPLKNLPYEQIEWFCRYLVSVWDWCILQTSWEGHDPLAKVFFPVIFKADNCFWHWFAFGKAKTTSFKTTILKNDSGLQQGFVLYLESQ